MDRFTTEILIRIHFCQISSRRGVGLGRYYHKSGGSGPTCWGNKPPGISCRLFMIHHLQQWTCARVAHHWYTLFEYDMQLERIYKLWKHPVTYFLKEFKFSHSIHFVNLKLLVHNFRNSIRNHFYWISRHLLNQFNLSVFIPTR